MATHFWCLDSESAPVGKKSYKNHPKKRHEHRHRLLCWLTGAKKKVGVQQEGVGRVRFVNACLAPSNPFANETLKLQQHSRPSACFSMSGRLFLIRVGHVLAVLTAGLGWA
jgi:hypothetical protein